MDVSKRESVDKLFSKINDMYSTPATVVVNSAGITRATFMLEMTDSQFDSVIAVNLKVSFTFFNLFN